MSSLQTRSHAALKARPGYTKKPPSSKKDSSPYSSLSLIGIRLHFSTACHSAYHQAFYQNCYLPVQTLQELLQPLPKQIAVGQENNIIFLQRFYSILIFRHLPHAETLSRPSAKLRRIILRLSLTPGTKEGESQSTVTVSYLSWGQRAGWPPGL